MFWALARMHLRRRCLAVFIVLLPPLPLTSSNPAPPESDDCRVGPFLSAMPKAMKAAKAPAEAPKKAMKKAKAMKAK